MRNLCFCLLVFVFLRTEAQNNTELYIAKYSSVAIDEMNRYNIPASITLAQGILESGNGTSRLAKKGNNHFGIKCHNNWNGKTITEDDDKKGECFRKYDQVIDSYRDHSLFLVEGKRYSFLFKYKNTDYKKWARGLKKAGYATNAEYDNLLINLIEKYKLSQFDYQQVDDRKFYFGNSYGFPYLIGIGGYFIKNRLIYSGELNTSFAFSEANVGCCYEVFNKLYIGGSSSFIYLPSKDNCLVPSVSSKLIYKKESILIKSGVQFPLRQIEYNLIPFVQLTYLIN